MRVERYDTLSDLNTGLAGLEKSGRKVIDVRIFSFTQVNQEGYPMQVPVFYVLHEKGVIHV